MRPSFLLALSCVVLGLAPAARAQASGPVPLTTHVGDPIPYTIGLPAGWEISRESRTAPTGTAHALSAVGGVDGAVAMVAADLVAGRRDRPAGVSEARMRRMMTETILGSDSLMHHMLRVAVTNQGGKVEEMVLEFGTLAGQRAAYMRGPLERAGMSISFEAHLTVRDGIAYVLTTLSSDERYASHAPLFARIRDSLVLAPAPAPK